MPDNTITVVGNVTRDPELRYTPSGQANTVLGIAVNRRWMNRTTNEWEEQVSFFNVVAWGSLAENVGESVAKGTRVVVTGRLEQRTYEKDDEKRVVVEVIADEIAPSLRWATVEVKRNERRPPHAASPSGGGGARRPAANQPPSYDDEEPF